MYPYPAPDNQYGPGPSDTDPRRPYPPPSQPQRPLTEVPPPSLPALPQLPPGFQHRLQVVQNPLHARMCGFGEKDRRPLDPPPIVQLFIEDAAGVADEDLVQNPFYVLHTTLWSEDMEAERSLINNEPKVTRVLMGTVVSSPSMLLNTESVRGCYFCFPDLSIRTEGRYRLRFSLFRLDGDGDPSDSSPRVVTHTFSDPFTVYSAKKFPGMTESTELSKAFARQGLKIPIRNENRPRRTDRTD